MKLRRIFVWSIIALVSGLGTADLCSSDDNESVLQTNHAYTYHFRSVALAQAVGTTEDQGKVVLDCGVRISHDHSCYYNLELQDCKLTASGGQPGSESPWKDQEPLPDLSKYHVTFSLVRGEIKDILVHQDDPIQVVNIKRGVLSAFVFKLSQTTEEIKEIHTDIHGTCPLKSVPEVDGKVKTTKDMLHCNFPSRPDWQFSPWSIFWNMTFIQHVINSSTDCFYRISENRLDTVHCKERHAIMLESTHKTTTAVQTNIFYSVDFVKSEPQNFKPALPILSRKTSIAFEYEDTSVPQTSPPDFLPIAAKMLSDLVLDSQDEIRLFTIPQFTDFVAWIRASHDLTLLVEEVRSCDFLPDNEECDDRKKEVALSFLSDALVQCNTVPCAKAITYIARNDDVSPTYLNFIYRTWSYMYYSKPGFVTNFAKLCKLKQSRQCWLSMGTFARRIISRNTDLNKELAVEIREVANHIHSRIEEECEATVGADNSHYTNCLIFLKAASNVGQYYGQLVPDGIGRLLEHATNDHSPTFVRTSALESIKEVHILNQYKEIYDEILPLLKNTSLPPSIRILAYDVLIPVSEGYHFEERLLDILKDEKDAEVQFYIADSLNSLFVDRDFRTKREKFINSLNELLQENNLSLEVILYDTKGKSKSSSYSTFLNLPFMPDSMKKFGMKVLESSLFDSFIYPTVLNQENIVELFSKLIPASKLGSYFEGWEELILTYKKNLANMNSKSPTFSNIFEALVKTLEEYGLEQDGSLVNFDENILKNIKKIHQLYWQHHKKLNPYVKGYLDLFGSTIKYMVQDSFQQSAANNDLAKLIRYIRSDLEEGLSYNTTRVIRVIEAYHQVPTMMGLPLNWTTNATLAFSMRAGLKYKHDIQGNNIHSKGFLQPSVALTFLNRMVLDFPTVTQIGVQANSSGCTSTEIRMQYNSAKGKQTLRLERPSKTQKVLELFRTNQLIKHNRYEDIADWDIERTSSSWCTKDSTSALQFCLSKSYPNVTHRIKPWALMAGWCKWQFLIHPIDKSRVYYDIQLQQAEKQRSKEYTAKFSVTEKEKEKAANFKMVMDESGKDMKFELKTSLSPEFLATLTSSDMSRNKRISGQKVEALLKFYKDFKYEMEYSTEERLQKPQSPPTKINIPSDESSKTRVDEEKFSLRTPYGAYKYNKTIYRVGENTKAEAAIEYENLNPKSSNWLRMILPPSLWVDNQRATAKVLLHWKQPIHRSEDGITTRQTEFRLVLPRETTTLLGDKLEMNDREQLNVNIAKKNHEEGKLESFLNFTYDMWRTENGYSNNKVVRQVNITIPRRSWAAVYHKTNEGMKYKHEVRLRRILMKPNDDQKSDYVGWWSNEVSDHFRLHEREIKLVADFEMQTLNPEELLSKYPKNLTVEDIKDLSSYVVDTNIALFYPFSERVETAVFDGYFIISRGMKTSRFQKTFDLTSTYNNLQLTSHSVYIRTDVDSVVSHHSYFTYLPTQAKAYHTIYYESVEPEGRTRPQITFKHDIRSKVFDLSTNVSYKSEPDNEDLYTLLLKVNTNSSKWNMLDMTIDQIIQNVSPDYRREDMTLNHPLGTIHVDAEWQGKHKDLQKRFVVCSKSGNCPNVELYIESFHDGKANWKLSLPNQNDTQITYERQMSSDYKTLQIKMGHSEKESAFVEFLDFKGEIVAEQFHVWKGLIDTKAAAKVKNLFQSAYDVARNAIVSVAKDKTHPLNEILQPSLKMTLYDYWNSVNKQVKEFFSVTWLEIKGAFYTLEAFMDPVYALLSNTITGIGGVFRVAYNSVKEKSITIWAINYFHVPYYIQQGVFNLPRGLKKLVQQLALQEEDVLHFKFMSGKIMSLGSFREWPSISFYPSWLTKIIHKETDSSASYKDVDTGHKLAMIFGPLHVYTFHGHMYDIPAYPHKDCVLLLAHDVHRSLFTVFSTENSLHILFPEMSLTIDDKNDVFVNGSGKSSSLPIQSSNGKVTVKRGLTVEVWSPSLSIVCSDIHFLCVLKLKEFHAGGVIGLLGNADEHAKNEFILPNGNATSSLLEYTKNYEISGKPECKNFVLGRTPLSSQEDVSICEEAFSDVCYNRPLVRERFLQPCVSDVRAGHGPCYAASGLSALCHFQYMPSHTNCNTKKQEKEQIGRNLEVILVVQENKHLTSPDHSTAPSKGIESLLRAIDVQFKDSGYNSVLYSLVAFGGNGVHYAPSIHSSRNVIWLPVDNMVNDVLKTLEFKSTEDADSVLALQYALDEIGYDSFDSKVVIVVSVKDRQVAEKSLTENIQLHLEENGITLYTISAYPSIEKGKKVFGVRADGLIFPSQTKDGDAYLDYPRGNLAKLTSSTKGSLFLSKFLSGNNPPSYFAEFAQEVWAKVNKEAQKCRLCSSVKAGWWWYRNKCAVAHC